MFIVETTSYINSFSYEMVSRLFTILINLYSAWYWIFKGSSFFFFCLLLNVISRNIQSRLLLFNFPQKSHRQKMKNVLKYCWVAQLWWAPFMPWSTWTVYPGVIHVVHTFHEHPWKPLSHPRETCNNTCRYALAHHLLPVNKKDKESYKKVLQERQWVHCKEQEAGGEDFIEERYECVYFSLFSHLPAMPKRGYFLLP